MKTYIRLRMNKREAEHSRLNATISNTQNEFIGEPVTVTQSIVLGDQRIHARDLHVEWKRRLHGEARRKDLGRRPDARKPSSDRTASRRVAPRRAASPVSSVPRRAERWAYAKIERKEERHRSDSQSVWLESVLGRVSGSHSKFA